MAVNQSQSSGQTFNYPLATTLLTPALVGTYISINTGLGDRLTYPISLSEYREMLEKLTLLIAVTEEVRMFVGNMMQDV